MPLRRDPFDCLDSAESFAEEEAIAEENIESVYGVRTDVVPVDGRPYVIIHADGSISLGKVNDGPADKERGSIP